MFKVNQMVSTVQNEYIQRLTQMGEVVTYTVAADLFYEGQIPVVAYLILDGHVHLLKGKKIKDTIGGGHLVGARELMNNINAKMSAQIMPKTKVCFLSKSDIQEILDNDDQTSEHLEELLNA